MAKFKIFGYIITIEREGLDLWLISEREKEWDNAVAPPGEYLTEHPPCTNFATVSCLDPEEEKRKNEAAAHLLDTMALVNTITIRRPNRFDPPRSYPAPPIAREDE